MNTLGRIVAEKSLSEDIVAALPRNDTSIRTLTPEHDCQASTQEQSSQQHRQARWMHRIAKSIHRSCANPVDANLTARVLNDGRSVQDGPIAVRHKYMGADAGILAVAGIVQLFSSQMFRSFKL